MKKIKRKGPKKNDLAIFGSLTNPWGDSYFYHPRMGLSYECKIEHNIV
jgi:hypothetical protein